MQKDSPAFPECSPLYERPDHYGNIKLTGFATSPGMSLRDYFAAKALPAMLNPTTMGIISSTGSDPTTTIAGIAYEYADAMLAAREPKPAPAEREEANVTKDYFEG